jgi:ATP-dependent RNA helicase RhlE
MSAGGSGTTPQAANSFAIQRILTKLSLDYEDEDLTNTSTSTNEQQTTAPRELSAFSELPLMEPLQRALAGEGYVTPTPIQAGAIPLLLSGRDVLGCAQTGTGKTAAFALPILQSLAASRSRPKTKQRTKTKRGPRRRIKTLVLSPTRELAAQIGRSFEVYGRYLDFRQVVVFGGVSQVPQVKALRRGVDVLVATPGRLLDLHGQGHIDFGDVEFFVLDEADRMLDMGFIHDIRRVLRLLPSERQNLLFSATLPPDIKKLASSFLDNAARVEVSPPATTVELIDQFVMFVRKADKRRLLAELLRSQEIDRALVFTRTKHGANRLAKQLDRADIPAAAIHGNKSQGARTRALDGFRRGRTPVLVATDVASRGIDVDGITHVFNFDLPNEPESYVHRIGRTGRAGHAGVAIAFCDETEKKHLRSIEQLIDETLEVITDHPYHHKGAVPPPEKKRATRSGPSRSSRAGARRSSGSSRGSSRRSSRAPSNRPSNGPSRAPSNRPSNGPPRAPSNRPSDGPSRGSSNRPSNGPPRGPSNRPSDGPSRQKSRRSGGSGPRRSSRRPTTPSSDTRQKRTPSNPSGRPNSGNTGRRARRRRRGRRKEAARRGSNQ